nr:MAG TPA: hypothetical protein [Caudoviricetes sp.]
MNKIFYEKVKFFVQSHDFIFSILHKKSVFRSYFFDLPSILKYSILSL